jgi:glutamine amidotransferase
MGWNEVSVAKPHSLVNGLPPQPRFYFVHSYHVVCAVPDDVLLQATYGIPFTAAFAHSNVLGVQFHPEKSHKFGMALLQAFAR